MNEIVSIEVDPVTASTLQIQADARGLTLADYLRMLAAESADTGANGSLSATDFERHLDELSADSASLPVLPATFGRADIYGDHD